MCLFSEEGVLDHAKVLQIYSQLPKVNQVILKVLCVLMKKIEQFKQFNMMTTSRLGKCLGYVILRPRKDTKLTDTQIPYRYIIGKWMIEILSETVSSEVKIPFPNIH